MRFLHIIIWLGFTVCHAQKTVPNAPFSVEKLPAAPDYTQAAAWAALPDKEDASDLYPKNFRDKVQSPDPKVDVFYIYPTIYEDGNNWNADTRDEKLNEQIQKLPLRNQATVFNGLANIYAPYYRQMHLHGYFAKGGEIAFDTAYADVERAFRYFIAHYNQGKRPFIIAAHSQGTNHGERLIREVIMPDSCLRRQLKLAYLVGMPIQTALEGFPPCTAAEDINCFLSWRTYGNDFVPKECGDSICSTHPITYRTDKAVNDFEAHRGILYRNFRIIFKKSIRVENKPGFLRVTGLRMPFKGLFKWDNYHIADYNMFWLNIRENFGQRLKIILSEAQ